MEWNGKEIKDNSLNFKEFILGGELVFVMKKSK